MPTPQELLARVNRPAEEALRLHPFYRGKVQILPRCPVRGLADFAVWYSPGVAAPCRAIQQNPELVYEHTNRGNCVAVVSDGTRVLGLGDIGPEAGLPVMEGKALLFKYLGGVDAFPLCLGTKDPDEFIRAVKLLEPSFGGINLEDIAQPKCFRILDTLRAEMGIPVWHDDQQGTATVLLAALLNALEVVGKDIHRVKLALVGMGAANVATYRLLKAAGIDPAAAVACDSKGVLHRKRHDVEERQAEFADKWRVCLETNAEGLAGGTDEGIAEALRGADVCIAFSRAGVIRPEWVQGMARDAVVFACANPVPEIWPWEAQEAGARIVGTGRGDFPNQVNNSLGFPAIFRGTLDVRARTISDEMALAAARELAAFAQERGIREYDVVPRMDEWEVFPRVAVATAMKAQEQGLAALTRSRQQLLEGATRMVRQAQEATLLLMREGIIASPPAEQEAAAPAAAAGRPRDGRTAALLRQRLEQAYRWYQGMVNPQTGLLEYHYLPRTNSFVRQNCPIRDIASVWDLEVLGGFLNRSEHLPVTEKSLRHFAGYLVPCGRHLILDPGRLGEPSSIAHSAFLMLALLHAQPPTDVDSVAALAEGILRQQRPDGSFQVYFAGHPDQGEELYAGEAMLALLEAYRLFPDIRYLQSAARGLSHYDARYFQGGRVTADLLVFFANWQSQACRLLFERTASPPYREEAADYAFRLHDQVIASGFYEAVERGPAAQVSVEVACALEGLNDAYALARASDGERAERYRRCVCVGLNCLLKLQALDGAAERQRGGFGTSLADPSQRVDVTGHAVSAFLKSVENGIECG